MNASPAHKISRQGEHATGEILGTGLRETCKAQAESDGSYREVSDPTQYKPRRVRYERTGLVVSARYQARNPLRSISATDVRLI